MSIETELDMSFGKNDFLAGNIVSHVGKLPELTEKVKVVFFLFPEVFGVKEKIKVENIKASEILMLSVNTSTTGGVVHTIKDNQLEIFLKKPIIVFKEDNVGIARSIGGHWRLIGYGKIV